MFKFVLIIVISMFSVSSVLAQGLLSSKQLATGAAAANIGAPSASVRGGPFAQSGYVDATGLGSAANYAPLALPLQRGTTNAVAGTLGASLNASTLNAIGDYGADPTGTAAFGVANLYADSNASNRCAYFPGGTYKITSQTIFQLSAVKSLGTCLTGDGVYRSLLDGSSVATSPVFAFEDTSGSVGSPATDFYIKAKDVGFKGNIAGTVLALGQSNFADQLNAIDITAWVANTSTSTSANAVTISNIFGPSNVRLVANNNGYGDAINVLGAQFSKFEIAAGNADIALHYSGTGYSYGNVIIAPDFEEVNTAVQFDAPNANTETFIGGTYAYSNTGLKCNSGHNHLFINPTLSSTGASNDISGTGCVILTGSGIKTGSDAATWNLVNSYGTFQMQFSGGSAYVTNYTPSGNLNYSVASGGAIAYFVNSVAELNITSAASIISNNITLASNLIQSVTAGTGASCTVVSTCHNNGGRVTIGTSPSTTVALVFNANAFSNIPVCFAQDETSAVTMRATIISTSGVTFTASATLTASDKVSYQCIGI